jgi:hypothetical protein
MMPINAMYRVCNDGPMFDSREEAEEYTRNNVGGTTWIDAMAWCDDCQDWVEEGRMEHCPECGGTWYSEEGYVGFRDGMGAAAWKLHKAKVEADRVELEERTKRERAALAAWNAGQPIRTDTGIWFRQRLEH